MSDAEDRAELDAIRASIRARKEAQNTRRAKAGKAPMWPALLKPAAAPKKSRAATPPPAESGDEDDTQLSFDEWKACGWVVKKGEKAAGFSIDGLPQFTRKQVKKINPGWEKWKKRQPR